MHYHDILNFYFSIFTGDSNQELFQIECKCFILIYFIKWSHTFGFVGLTLTFTLNVTKGFCQCPQFATI